MFMRESLRLVRLDTKYCDYLRKYETFCKSVNYKAKETNFGVDDIAFFDKNDNLLLRTTTHEGFIFVDESIDKLFQNNK